MLTPAVLSDANRCWADVMTQEYRDQLMALIARVDPVLPPRSAVEVKHFFGGAAAYIDGHIFMSLTKVGLALKLPEEDRERLFRTRQAKKLRYFPKAPVKKQYALFSRVLLDDGNSAKTWIEKSVGYVMTSADRS